MYHHPIITLAIFVTGFTTIELGIVTTLWLAAAFYFSLQAPRTPKPKASAE